jgi:phenylacetic acid degradation operon negative regulatory protein
MDAPANPAEAALQRLIERLHRRGRVRVWSLVITIFGDAIVPRGGRVALGALQEVVGRLGVEPGALRTALSRLAGDHWVTRERNGRNSYYRLAESGRHSFDLATRRIYSGGPPQWDGSWTVAIAPPGGDANAGSLAEAGFVKVEGRVYLRPETAGALPADQELAGMLVVHGTGAEHPENLRILWPSEEIADAYRSFTDAVKPLASALKDGGTLPPLAAMAARTLVIHGWRRVVLRDPGLPDALLPEDWPGEEARALVRAAYRALLQPSEEWLDKAGLPQPVDPASFTSRFG